MRRGPRTAFTRDLAAAVGFCLGAVVKPARVTVTTSARWWLSDLQCCAPPAWCSAPLDYDVAPATADAPSHCWRLHAPTSPSPWTGGATTRPLTGLWAIHHLRPVRRLLRHTGSMRATLLGTAGWMPSQGRETACISVRLGKTLVLLDAGTGVRRLITDPSHLIGIESIHVLLSHFHLDHSVGLTYLSAIAEGRSIRISGPGSWLYGTTTKSILGRLVEPPYQPPRLTGDFEIGEIGPREMEIEGVRVHARGQTLHSAPTAAFRLGESLAYLTDTAYDAESKVFATGVAVLMHEAFMPSDGDPRHSSAREAAQVAAGAGVDELCLIHMAPRAREDELIHSARGVFSRTRVGKDEETIEILGNTR